MMFFTLSNVAFSKVSEVWTLLLYTSENMFKLYTLDL